MLIRLVLAAALAVVWMVGSASSSPTDTTQVSKVAGDGALMNLFNTTSIRREPLTREERKKRRERQKEKRKKRKRQRNRKRKRNMESNDPNKKKKNKNKNRRKRNKRKGKKRKKCKKQKRMMKKKMKMKMKNQGALTSEQRREKRKEWKAKLKKACRRRPNKRRSALTCKKDEDCAKAGPNYCCQFVTGRCVRPREGLKCFGSCMCNARKRTQNFICVTKKKKYQKFLEKKKSGVISYEKPRGHCRNVTLSELNTASYRYQQIP